MIQKYIWIFGILILFSCTLEEKRKQLPNLLELQIVDSIRVSENGFFLNGQTQVKMIGDSLIAVSSIKKPAVGIISIKTGEQIAQITSSDFPESPFFPSSFAVDDFPVIYIADRFSNSILSFNAIEGKFLNKIKLQLPPSKVIKIALGQFFKIESGFLIELSTSNLDTNHPDYYRKSGNLIYFYSNKGEIIDSLINFPEVFRQKEGTMGPVSYITSTVTENEWIYSFPHEGRIKVINLDTKKAKEEDLALPLSRYFNFELQALDRVVSFEDFENGDQVKLPFNDYFNSMINMGGNIFIQTWMTSEMLDGETNRLSNLLIYNKAAKKWSETSNPKNILDIGMLAGVVNDTLYFYEGSLMKSDEKYIKRAVLKPIKD